MSDQAKQPSNKVRYQLTIETRSPGCVMDLRMLLKFLLRRYGFRCVTIKEVK